MQSFNILVVLAAAVSAAVLPASNPLTARADCDLCDEMWNEVVQLCNMSESICRIKAIEWHGTPRAACDGCSNSCRTCIYAKASVDACPSECSALGVN